MYLINHYLLNITDILHERKAPMRHENEAGTGSNIFISNTLSLIIFRAFYILNAFLTLKQGMSKELSLLL